MCIVVGLLLLITFPLLGADSKVFNISQIDSDVTKIEFKVGQSPWREVNLDSKQIEVPNSSDELLLRQYSGPSIVGGELLYRYDNNLETWVYVREPQKERLEVTLSPYATAMFTNQALKHMYTLFFGVGLDSEFSFEFHRALLFKFNIEAKYAKSNNIWADSFFIFGGDVGVGYRFELGKGFLLTPSVTYGVLFHYCIGTLEESLGQKLHLQQMLALNLEAGYKFSSKMIVFVAPKFQFMLDNTRNGFLYGLRAGVGFVL